MIHCVLGISFSRWRLRNCVDGVLTSVFLSRYSIVGCCGINGILSLSCFGVYLGLSCVFLFTSQVRIILDGILLSVGCLSYRVFSISLSCWRLWHIIDGLGTFVLLSRHIRIRCRGVDGVLSFLRFGINFRLSCILLFACQVRIFLNRVLLSVSCLSDCILGVSFSCRRLWYCIDGLCTFGLLSRYIRVRSSCVDGILCLLSFGINFPLSGILLFACQVRIVLNRILLRVSCLSDRILRISLSGWHLWHCIDSLRTFILLSCYICVRCRGINGILSLCSFGVYLGFSGILLFASQVRIILDSILLSVRCLSDCILSVGLSLRRLRNGIDSLRTFVLLSRHVIVASCGIDSILGLSRFGVYLSFGCILLFASQVWIVFDG